MGGGEAPRDGINHSHSTGNVVNDTIALRGTDSSCTCGERGVRYGQVESSRCTPETNVTLCVKHSSIIKEKDLEGFQNSPLVSAF